MPIRINELATEPREHDQQEQKHTESGTVRHFSVRGFLNENDAIAGLKANQADIFFHTVGGETLVLDKITVRERLSADHYYLDAHYKHPEDEERDLEIGEFRLSFDTTGRTFNRQLSLETLARANLKDPFVAPLNFQKAINVNTDGTVEGVDVVVPSLKFQITKKQKNTLITLDYIATVMSLTGKTNDADVFGFEKGELLFLGATGGNSLSIEVGPDETEVDQGAEITYHFEASPNSTIEVDVFDSVVTRDKKGWEYLWFYMEEEIVKDEDDTEIVTLQQPSQLNLEKVYEEGDFTKLQILPEHEAE